MGTSKPISPFRLCSLLRSQKDPSLALQLFQNSKPLRHSLLSYDIIITKLGRAKMFTQMEQILQQLHHQTRFQVPEPLLCHVISFYGRAHLPSRAIQTFLSIPSSPTVKSFNSLLHALLTSRQFHTLDEFASRVPHPDTCTFNILINSCSLRGDLERARHLFDEMLHRHIPPNEITFGTLINGFCKNSLFKEALKLKDDMINLHKLKPNVNLYTTLIKGACKVGDLRSAFRIKDEMVGYNVRLDAPVYNTLMDALFKSGMKVEGWGVLNEMSKSGCKPDLVTYNVMIAEFCRENKFEEAIRILDGMEEGVKPDVVSYNVIIGGLCKEGKWGEASDLFQDMPRRGCDPDVVTYRTLFDGLCSWMQFREAAFVLDEMVFKGHLPLSGSFNRFVDGLCQEGNFELLSTVFSGLGSRANLSNEVVWNNVVSMVCKPNKLSEPSELFDTLVVQ